MWMLGTEIHILVPHPPRWLPRPFPSFWPCFLVEILMKENRKYYDRRTRAYEDQKCHGLSGTGVIGGCEPLSFGVGNWTWVLWKAGSILNHWTISLVFLSIPFKQTPVSACLALLLCVWLVSFSLCTLSKPVIYRLFPCKHFSKDPLKQLYEELLFYTRYTREETVTEVPTIHPGSQRT